MIAICTYCSRPTSGDICPVHGYVGAAKSTSDLGAGYVPVGGIIMWGGALTSIPPHFALCDGTRGTPDLRDRFILGAGSAAVGSTGGAWTSAHTHSVATSGGGGGETSGAGGASHTVTQPTLANHGDHAHYYGNGYGTYSGIGAADTDRQESSGSSTAFRHTQIGHVHTLAGSITANTFTALSHSLSPTSVAAHGDHTHSIGGYNSENITSGSTAPAIVPPYYALAFIKRIS